MRDQRGFGTSATKEVFGIIERRARKKAGAYLVLARSVSAITLVSDDAQEVPQTRIECFWLAYGPVV